MNLQDILKRPANSFQAPRPLPVGTYVCLIEGQPEHVKMGKKNTDAINFTLKPIQAHTDVDPEALRKALENGDGTSKPLHESRVVLRHWVTPDATYRLREFLVNDLGLDGSKSFELLIPEAMGKQVLATFMHSASDDGSRIFVNVKSTAKV